MKQPFLVAYDYGQGGVWAIVSAESASEIEGRFPELAVIAEPPKWMTPEELQAIEREATYDIDETSGLLADIVRRRR